MGKCPACKTKLKLTPRLRFKMMEKPQPCPNCGVMIFRPMWPWLLWFAGVMLLIGEPGLLDPEKRHWVRQLILNGHRDVFWALEIAQGVAGVTLMVTSIVLTKRFRIAREK